MTFGKMTPKNDICQNDTETMTFVRIKLSKMLFLE